MAPHVNKLTEPTLHYDEGNPDEKQQQYMIDDTEPEQKSGIFGASSNLVNSIVGAGIIGVPYALKQSGLIAGVFLLCLVGYLTDKSLRIMIDTATFHPKLKDKGVRDFETLAYYAFGNFGRNFILLCMFVMAYGAMVAYLLIIKDTLPPLLGFAHGAEGGFEREAIMMVTSLLIMVPLSMQRDMATLAFTSCISVMADIVLVFFIMFFAPISETVADAGGFLKVLESDGVEPTIFIGLGVLSTAMACQHSAFIVSGSLENLTRQRWAIVTGGSIGTATLLCAILGVSGYLGFLENTQGDVLNNFEADLVANGARALLAVTMFFTYPMESFVGRHVLTALVYDGDMEGPNSNLILNRRRMTTMGLYILTLIPALIFDDLGPVLSITGSVGGSCIAYVAPGAVFLGVNGGAFLAFAYGLLSKRDNNGDIELPAVGDTNHANLESWTTCREDSIKPCWWYILGFPIWCAIATHGSTRLEQNISQTNTDQNSLQDNLDYQEMKSLDVQKDQNNSLPVPTGLDYFAATFFITFGVIACVAGLSSNIVNIWVGLQQSQ